MMFRRLTCSQELSNKFGRNHPEFCLPIRFAANNQFPLIQNNFYLYETAGAEYFYQCKKFKDTKAEIYVTSFGEFNEEDFKTGFREFEKTEKVLERREKFGIAGDEIYAKALLPLLDEFKLTHACYPTVEYFMTSEQEKYLLTIPEQALPEGYELTDATMEDANILIDFKKYTKPADREAIRMLIEKLPSTCLRFEGKPVGIELIYANGMQNFLSVLPEHRGKGLGYAVELNLARKLIKEGYFVFKSVLEENTSVITQTDKLPYWTKKVKPDGTASLRVYVSGWGEETMTK